MRPRLGVFDMNSLFHDFCHSFRQLRRSPGFAHWALTAYLCSRERNIEVIASMRCKVYVVEPLERLQDERWPLKENSNS